MAKQVQGLFGASNNNNANKAARRRRSKHMYKGHCLRKYQGIFLYILSQAKGPLTKDQLMDMNKSMRPENSIHRKGGSGYYDYILVDAVGSANPETRKKNEVNEGYPSLITLGLVDCYTVIRDLKPTPLYSITEEGRKFVITIMDEVIEKYFNWDE